MAAVPVTISGVLCDKYGRTIQVVTLVGEASFTGLGVGGGPVIPPGGSEGPPGIWGGGNVPMPTPPIANVPGAPGYKPPTIWPSPGHPEHPIYLPPGIWPNPPEGQAPHPEHPIVIPIEPPEGTDGPPLEVKVVWTPQGGWQVVLVPTGPHPAPSK